jgi:hypothetical protein
VWEFLRFAFWVILIAFSCDFVYAAFHQGRHLTQAFKYRSKKRSR